MRYAWLLACITIQVCTTTRAEALPVELVAPVPEGKCMHNTHSRSLPGTGMHGRGPPCMPPGPRKASLILLSLYAHLSDWPANKQAGIYRLNASSGCWVMGPGTHGSSPPCLPLGAPACIQLLYVVEAQIEIRHAARYPEDGLVFRRNYLYTGGATGAEGAAGAAGEAGTAGTKGSHAMEVDEQQDDGTPTPPANPPESQAARQQETAMAQQLKGLQLPRWDQTRGHRDPPCTQALGRVHNDRGRKCLMPMPFTPIRAVTHQRPLRASWSLRLTGDQATPGILGPPSPPIGHNYKGNPRHNASDTRSYGDPMEIHPIKGQDRIDRYTCHINYWDQ